MRRSTWWTAATLVALFIVVAYWGYRESQEKNALLIKAENEYQRHFADLVRYVDELNDALGKAIATNGAGPQTATLSTVWRLSSAAQNAAGALPLSLLPLAETEQFLERIGDFAYQIIRRDVHRSPVTAEERRTMAELYRASGDIQAHLQKMQADIYAKKLRWMDVEQALAEAHLAQDQGIVDGIEALGERSKTYMKLDMGALPVSGMSRREAELRRLADAVRKPIDEHKAADIARQAVGAPKTAKADVVVVQDEAPLYDVSIDARPEGAQKGARTLVELTADGRVLWWMNTREVGEARYSLDQAAVRAERAFRRRSYPELRLIRREVYGGNAVLTYVPVERGIVLYPDAIVVNVALDDGSVVGLNQTDFVLFHRPRANPTPKLSIEAAKRHLDPTFRVEAQETALIVGETGQEVLTYAYTGTLGQSRYRIFLNADTGIEENVEIIHDGP
ncbi:MAG: germination protein YpeB [Hydrogenibacillus sp.]|nr:germination protein YpeB [Hydrogenibacillus sp.]